MTNLRAYEKFFADVQSRGFASLSCVFVVMSEDTDANECALKMERVAQQVASHDYHIAYGIAHRENGIRADRIAQEADERMLENKRAYYAKHERRRP